MKKLKMKMKMKTMMTNTKVAQSYGARTHTNLLWGTDFIYTHIYTGNIYIHVGNDGAKYQSFKVIK